MDTNKSLAVRLSSSRFWPIKSYSPSGSAQSIFSIQFISFIERFFSQPLVRRAGIVYSHAIISHNLSSYTVEIFLQDSRILDFYFTLPKFRLFTRPRRIARRGVLSNRKRKSFRKIIKNKLFFRSRPPFVLLSQLISHYKNFLPNFRKIYRFRLRKRRSAFKPSFFYYSIYRFNRSVYGIRRRFYSFLTKIFSAYFSYGFPASCQIRFVLLDQRSATAQLLLNYLTTKLYYRYILNDLINPLVRQSLRHYRGFSITCRGRFTRAQMATERSRQRGKLRFSSAYVPLDFSQKSVVLKYGVCNLKIWIRH